MVSIINDIAQTELVFNTKDYNVPLDHKARFFVDFMEEFMDEYGLGDYENNIGRTPYSSRSMLKLIVYAKTNHVTSSEDIADLATFHDVYKYVCDYITPSARSIRRFKKDFKHIYNEILKKTLKKAEEDGLTTFNHVPVDGTIKKAYNNLHNTITEKETDILLGYYNGENIDDETLEKLRKPVKNFMMNEKMDEDEKISLLKRIKNEFTKTKQEKIPLNDIESRKMKGKRGNFKIAYNMQSAVDSETGLICAITISQNPTDHIELPTIVDKAIKNMGKKPEFVSADTIYLNNHNTSYLVKEDINGLIPNRKQSKEDSGRLNENPYHKDHFEYDIDTDTFKCPEGQYLTFYKEYTIEKDEKTGADKIRRLYNNYGACKDCKQKNKCITSKQTHRTITENGDRLQRAMYVKMEKEEYRNEYQKRSTVERPFGPLKIQYSMENEVVIGIEDTECYMTLNAVAYNINRLYNLLYENQVNKELTEECNNKFMKLMETTLDCAYS